MTFHYTGTLKSTLNVTKKENIMTKYTDKFRNNHKTCTVFALMNIRAFEYQNACILCFKALRTLPQTTGVVFSVRKMYPSLQVGFHNLLLLDNNLL